MGKRRRQTYLCEALSIMQHPASLRPATVEFVGSRSTARRQATLFLGHVAGTTSAARKHQSGLGLGQRGLGQNQNPPRIGGKELQQAQLQHLGEQQGGQQLGNQGVLCVGWKALNLLFLEVRRQSLGNFLSWSPLCTNAADRTLRTFVEASS